jgi:hypothetical protein
MILRERGYNRGVRKAVFFLLISCLAGCKHGVQSDDAVRQAVLDYLSGPMGLNIGAMDVKVDKVSFEGEKAKAGVTIALKGNSTPMMTKQYELEQKDGKWVVVARKGESGHGATMPGGGPGAGGAMPGPVAPGTENPHGGGAMPAAQGAGGKMPSPDDLPPAGKKK